MRVFKWLAVGGFSVLLSTTVLAQSLPVDKVILSTAGLAHIEHSVNVTGNQDLGLAVRLGHVDDILKSMVIFDAKGRLGGVTLPGRQPLAEIFRDLPFSQGDLSDPIMLLNAYQGANVTATTGSASHKGQLLRVTAETILGEGGTSQTKYRLSIMTADGLKRLWLDETQSLQFDDAAIKDEIKEALAAIRKNATADQREMTVALRGEGSRNVRLAYVIDAPLWKAAYRVVAPAAGADAKSQGLLQGWAVVENMTASDWKNIELTLVSGNPVTYRQALYTSYYATRPEIPVEVLGRVMPRVDSGVVASADKIEGEYKRQSARAENMMQKSMAPPMPAAAPMGMAFAAADMAAPMEAISMEQGAFAGGVDDVAAAVNAASSAEATTQVLFRFPDRISLDAGQSMMVPFLSATLPMERVSVYQPDTHPSHPLAAVEVKNDSDSGLPPGVLTLYEENAGLKGTAYVGDAKLPVLTAGEKRLVTYALDSKVTIDRNNSSDTQDGRISISGGVLRLAQTVKEKTTYTVKAPPKEARMVIIEHPRRGDFKLISPDPKEVEVADQYYRIRVALKAGEEKALDVVLENIVWQSYSMVDFSTGDFINYASAGDRVDAKTRKVFEELAEMRRKIDVIDQEIATLERERETIFNDQARVRENLGRLQGKSDVQQKYLTKLSDQEDRLLQLSEETSALQVKRDEALAELRARINKIEVAAE